MEPASLWSQTPRSFAAIMKGIAERRQREQRDRGWLAYYSGLLGSNRLKKLPTLNELMGVETRPAVQTRAEMRAAFAAWRSGPQAPAH